MAPKVGGGASPVAVAQDGGRACEHRPQAYSALCPADSKGWQAALQALSLPQLSGALEDRVREMGESRGPDSPPALKVIHSCVLEPSRLRSSNCLPPFSGRVLCLVTQSLEKLQVLNGKENWREP